MTMTQARQLHEWLADKLTPECDLAVEAIWAREAGCEAREHREVDLLAAGMGVDPAGGLDAAFGLAEERNDDDLLAEAVEQPGDVEEFLAPDDAQGLAEELGVNAPTLDKMLNLHERDEFAEAHDLSREEFANALDPSPRPPESLAEAFDELTLP
ncbi:MAG TPA: hypothetical protein VFI09_00885 [Solirubrobacterales bacterium]|nr:hypothetical protein [Solirubrobacterales bacterium]